MCAAAARARLPRHLLITSFAALTIVARKARGCLECLGRVAGQRQGACRDSMGEADRKSKLDRLDPFPYIHRCQSFVGDSRSRRAVRPSGEGAKNGRRAPAPAPPHAGGQLRERLQPSCLPGCQTGLVGVVATPRLGEPNWPAEAKQVELACRGKDPRGSVPACQSACAASASTQFRLACCPWICVCVWLLYTVQREVNMGRPVSCPRERGVGDGADLPGVGQPGRR